MIGDIQQSAKNWLADHISNFGNLLKEGDDPSCIIEYQGVEIEIRLNKLEGVFDREILDVPKPPPSADIST